MNWFSRFFGSKRIPETNLGKEDEQKEMMRDHRAFREFFVESLKRELLKVNPELKFKTSPDFGGSLDAIQVIGESNVNYYVRYKMLDSVIVVFEISTVIENKKISKFYNAFIKENPSQEYRKMGLTIVGEINDLEQYPAGEITNRSKRIFEKLYIGWHHDMDTAVNKITSYYKNVSLPFSLKFNSLEKINEFYNHTGNIKLPWVFDSLYVCRFFIGSISGHLCRDNTYRKYIDYYLDLIKESNDLPQAIELMNYLKSQEDR